MGSITSCLNNCMEFICDEDCGVMTNDRLFISTDFMDDGIVHNSIKAPRVRFSLNDDSPPFEFKESNDCQYTGFEQS